MSPIAEKKWFLFLLLLGASLRLFKWQFSPVEHFDEGIYASNFWFDASENYRYPDRHLYAPPFLPAVIEWLHLLIGPSTLACLLPSLLLGCGSIWLVWRLGRMTGGPVAGLLAAGFWSCNDFAILYSRTALTESCLCFWMLLAVLLAAICLQPITDNQNPTLSAGRMMAIWAGLTAGIAWLTKYNGWLSLAIILSGSCACGIFSRWSRQQWLSWLGKILLMILAAFAIWIPYWRSLTEYGGYAVVAANHRQYFVGLSGWLDSWLRQCSHVWALSSWTFLAAMLIALILLTQRNLTTNSKTEPSITDERREYWQLPAYWMMLSWWCGLLVAVPLYYPYPRLQVPWQLASCLLAGWLLSRITQLTWLESISHRSTRLFVPVTCLVAVVVAFIGPLTSAPAWEDRTALSKISAEIVSLTDEIARHEHSQPQEVVFYIYGEPALFYHISASDRLAGPIGHLDFADRPLTSRQFPTFLVTGPHANDSPLFAEQWQKKGNLFQLLSEWDYRPSRFIQRNGRAGTGQAAKIKLWVVKASAPQSPHPVE